MKPYTTVYLCLWKGIQFYVNRKQAIPSDCHASYDQKYLSICDVDILFYLKIIILKNKQLTINNIKPEKNKQQGTCFCRLFIKRNDENMYKIPVIYKEINAYVCLCYMCLCV